MSPALRDMIVFQCGWLACVLGGNTGAALAALVLLPLQALWPGRRQSREWTLVLLFASVGVAMDLGWQALGVLRFDQQIALGIPLWLVVLWLLFSGTLFRSLAFLQQRLLLASVLGAASGPLSYIAGLRFGAATSSHDTASIVLAMAPAWAVLLPLLAFLARAPAARSESA